MRGDALEVGLESSLHVGLGGIRIRDVERAAPDEESAVLLERVVGQRIADQVVLREARLFEPHRRAEGLVLGCGRALLRDFPDYAPIFAELELEVGKLKVASHNDLLRTLEGAGLIEIALVESDLRRRAVWLTEAGARRLEAAIPVWRRAQARLSKLLSPGLARRLADEAEAKQQPQPLRRPDTQHSPE